MASAAAMLGRLKRGSLAQEVERAEEDGSLCWQHWVATWLSVVRGTAELVAAGLVSGSGREAVPEPQSGRAGDAAAQGAEIACESAQDAAARSVGEDVAGQELEDALVAWEGVTMMLGVGLSSGNTYVVRAAVRAVSVPMARAADR